MGDSINTALIISLVNNISQPIKQIGNDLSSFTKSNQAELLVLTGLYTNLTSSIKNIGISAAVGFADFESSMSKFGAITQSSAEDMEEVTKVARKLGSETTFKAKEVADAMVYLGMAGFDTEATLASIAPTLDLAAASGTELAKTADIMSNILTGFQLETSESSRVVDVLAKTVTTANTDVLQMGEAMKGFAPTASAFGISVEEASAMVGILGNAGIQGSLATTTLATSLTRLAAPPKAAAEAMEALNLEVFDSNGEFVGMAEMIKRLEQSFEGLTTQQKQGYIATIFGAEALSQMNVLVAAGSDELKNYTAELSDSAGIAKKMATEMLDNLGGAWEKFTGSIDDKMLTIGATLAVVLTPLLEKLAGIIDNISPSMMIFMGTLGSLAIALGGVLIVLPMIVNLVNTMRTSWGLLNIAMGGTLGPIGMIITVLGLLFVAWQTNFLGIQDITKQVWEENLKPIFDKFVDEWLPLIMGALQQLYNFFKIIWDGILVVVKVAIEFISNFIKNNWETIQNITENIWGVISGIIELTFGIISGVIKTILQIISGDWSGAWETIKITLSNARNSMKQIISSVGELIKIAIKGLWEGVKLIFDIAWEGIKKILSDAWENMKDVVSVGADFISEKWDGMVTKLQNIISSGVEYVKKKVSWLLKLLGIETEEMSETVETNGNAMSGKWGEVWDRVAGVAEEKLKALVENAKQWGANMGDMLANGIESGKSKIANAAVNLAAGIKEKLGFSSPTESGPASDSDTWMPNFITMLAEGLENGQKPLAEKSAMLAQILEDSLSFEGLNGTDKLEFAKRFLEIADELATKTENLSSFKKELNELNKDLIKKENELIQLKKSEDISDKNEEIKKIKEKIQNKEYLISQEENLYSILEKEYQLSEDLAGSQAIWFADIEKNKSVTQKLYEQIAEEHKKIKAEKLTAYFEDLNSKMKEAFSGNNVNIDQMKDKIKGFKDEIEKLDEKLNSLWEDKAKNRKDGDLKLANRAVEIDEEIKTLEGKNLDSDGKAKLEKLKAERDLVNQHVTGEQKNSVIAENAKSETEKILDLIALKDEELNQEINRLSAEKEAKLQAIAAEEKAIEDLYAVKTTLEEEYQRLFNEGIEKQKMGVQELINLSKQIGNYGGNTMSDSENHIVGENIPQTFIPKSEHGNKVSEGKTISVHLGGIVINGIEKAADLPNELYETFKSKLTRDIQLGKLGIS